MGRLNGMNTYLVGSIDACPDGGEVWRRCLTPKLEAFGINVFDPTAKPLSLTKGKEDRETRELIEHYKTIKDWDKVRELAKPIRQVDLRLVDLSHFILMHLNNKIMTCGTHEEWVTANRQKKPIIVHCQQGKATIPNWMFGAMPHELFFSTWEEVLSYLKVIDSTCDESLIHPRWVFA